MPTTKSHIPKYGYLTPWSPCPHVQWISMGFRPSHEHMASNRLSTSREDVVMWMIRYKASIMIILVESSTPFMMVEALSQTVCFINQIQTMPAQRITLNHQCKWWQQSMQKNHGVHSWWSGSTTMASTSKTCHSSNQWRYPTALQAP